MLLKDTGANLPGNENWDANCAVLSYSCSQNDRHPDRVRQEEYDFRSNRVTRSL